MGFVQMVEVVRTVELLNVNRISAPRLANLAE